MVALLKPRRRSLHATITPAFGLSLLLFFLVASQAFRGTNRLIVAGQRVSQANEAIAKLASANNFVERAGADQREYLSTAEARYIDQMRTDMGQATDDLHAVRELVSDSSTQKQSLTKLEEMVAAEFEDMGHAHRHPCLLRSG